MGINFNNSLVIGFLVSLSAIASAVIQPAIAQNSPLAISDQTTYKNQSPNQPDFLPTIKITIKKMIERDIHINLFLLILKVLIGQVKFQSKVLIPLI